MVYKEIGASKIGDRIIQEISRERSFAKIAVNVINENHTDFNIKEESRIYRDTLEDIEKVLGTVPSFMKLFPRESLVQDWPLWKMVGEIDLERARYLLNIDDMLEEILEKPQK